MHEGNQFFCCGLHSFEGIIRAEGFPFHVMIKERFLLCGVPVEQCTGAPWVGFVEAFSPGMGNVIPGPALLLGCRYGSIHFRVGSEWGKVNAFHSFLPCQFSC